MHIMEGYLPPSHAIAWGVVSTPFLIHGIRTVQKRVGEHPDGKVILAAAGAFSFVLSALKIPSVTGSSSHPTGTPLGALILGPPVSVVISMVVLLFQALLLSHGGLTTLGANLFSMGIAGPYVAYFIYHLMQRVRLPVSLSIFAAAALGDLFTYVVTSLQLALAFPDGVSGVLGAFLKFMGIFSLTQVPLAIGEGVLTLLVIRSIASFQGEVSAVPGLYRGRRPG